MARGFLSGVLWGGVVGVGVSGAASVMAPPPAAPQVGDAAPVATAAPAPVDADTVQEATGSDAAPATGLTAPQAPVPQQDSALNLDRDTLTSAAQPQPQTPAPAALNAPEAAPQAPVVGVENASAVIPTPQALAPMSPQDPDDVAIDTAPADPPAVVVAQEPASAVPAPQEPAQEAPQIADATVDAQPETVPELPAETETEAETQTAQTPASPAVPEDDATPQTVTAEADAPEDLQPEVSEAPDETEASQEAGTPQQTETAVAQPAANATTPSGPLIGTQVGSLLDRETTVTIRRPSSASLGEVDDGTAQDVADEVATPAASDDPRPISRYAAAFTPDPEKPLMSIVLIDDGSSPVSGAAGIAALRSFPYPLSYAVDTTLPDAVARMEAYRKEGFEVLAMVDLPEGAQPEDAEIAFGAILPQMDEVVGVLEGTLGGLQSSREVSDQVTSILLQTGHGLLTLDKGLNTMPKLARKEGVPADPIFRDFDSKGQTAAVIRRFLDQAAFKAGQEGAVVMLGRLRPDTVSALLLWGLQDRAGKVSLAPISAVLLREE